VDSLKRKTSLEKAGMKGRSKRGVYRDVGGQGTGVGGIVASKSGGCLGGEGGLMGGAPESGVVAG